MTESQRVYIVDSSTLIRLGRYYPRYIFPSIWKHIHSLIVDGRLIIHSEVRKEIEEVDDPVKEWLRAMDKKYNLVKEATKFQAQKIGEICESYPHFVAYDTDKAYADPFLIAAALEYMGEKQKTITGVSYDYCILTEERKGSQRKNYDNPTEVKRIPDYCKIFGIHCVNLFELLELEGWKY